MNDKLKRLLSLGLFVVNLAAIVWLWFSGRSFGMFGQPGGAYIALGNLAGLLAAYFVLWQLLIIARVGWLERPWGHDRLSRIHHYLGLTALVAIAVHPVLLTLGYSAITHTGLVGQFMSFINYFRDVWQALIAYVLFVVIVLMALTIVMKRLKYETWYYIHVILYLAIILAFGHQAQVGRDLRAANIVFYWNFLFFATLALVLYYRFARPAYLFFRHDFRVVAVRSEMPGVVSVSIGGKDLERLKARAGQFIIVRFLVKGLWWQAHPFSFSSAPGDTWRLTIKSLGDHTARLTDLPVGTRVIVEGPLGRFTSDLDRNPKVILVAGGIGISPLRSLLEQFVREKRKVDLIYSASKESDFVLRDELHALTHDGVTVHYVATDTAGRVNVEMILNMVPDVAERSAFICGPKPMMHAVRDQLISLGVRSGRIHFEEFQLG